jgi:hypothetical protein
MRFFVTSQKCSEDLKDGAIRSLPLNSLATLRAAARYDFGIIDRITIKTPTAESNPTMIHNNAPGCSA